MAEQQKKNRKENAQANTGDVMEGAGLAAGGLAGAAVGSAFGPLGTAAGAVAGGAMGNEAGEGLAAQDNATNTTKNNKDASGDHGTSGQTDRHQ